jgi:hypothetical protein
MDDKKTYTEQRLNENVSFSGNLGRKIAARIGDRNSLRSALRRFIDRYSIPGENKGRVLQADNANIVSKINENNSQIDELSDNLEHAGPIMRMIDQNRIQNLTRSNEKLTRSSKKLSEAIYSNEQIISDYERFKQSSTYITGLRVARVVKNIVNQFAKTAQSVIYSDADEIESEEDKKEEEKQKVKIKESVLDANYKTKSNERVSTNPTQEVPSDNNISNDLSSVFSVKDAEVKDVERPYNFLTDIYNGNEDTLKAQLKDEPEILEQYNKYMSGVDRTALKNIFNTYTLACINGNTKTAIAADQALRAISASHKFSGTRDKVVEFFKDKNPDIYSALMAQDKTNFTKTLALGQFNGLTTDEFNQICSPAYMMLDVNQRRELALNNLALMQKLEQDPTFINKISGKSMNEILQDNDVLQIFVDVKAKAEKYMSDSTLAQNFKNNLNFVTNQDANRFAAVLKDLVGQKVNSNYEQDAIMSIMTANDQLTLASLGKITFKNLADQYADIKNAQMTKKENLPKDTIIHFVGPELGLSKRDNLNPTTYVNGKVAAEKAEKEIKDLQDALDKEKNKIIHFGGPELGLSKQDNLNPTTNVSGEEKSEKEIKDLQDALDKEKNKIIHFGGPELGLSKQDNLNPTTNVSGEEKSLDEKTNEKKEAFEKEASVKNANDILQSENRKDDMAYQAAANSLKNIGLLPQEVADIMDKNDGKLPYFDCASIVQGYEEGKVHTSGLLYLINKNDDIKKMVLEDFNNKSIYKAISKPSQVKAFLDADVINDSDVYKFVNSEECHFDKNTKGSLSESAFVKSFADKIDSNNENKYANVASELYGIESKYGLEKQLFNELKDSDFADYYEQYSSDLKKQEQTVKNTSEILVAASPELTKLKDVIDLTELAKVPPKEKENTVEKIRKNGKEKLANQVDRFNNLVSDTVARVEDNKKSNQKVVEEVLNVRRNNIDYNNSLNKNNSENAKEIENNNKQFEEFASAKLENRSDARDIYEQTIAAEQKQVEQSRDEEEFVDVSTPATVLQGLSDKYNAAETLTEKNQILKEMRDDAKMSGISSDDLIDMIMNNKEQVKDIPEKVDLQEDVIKSK